MLSATAALVASAFLHSLWNVLLKRERDPEIAVAGVLAAALAVAAIAALAAPAPWFATSTALWWALGAGAFEGLYFVTLAASLARAEYGAVYTVARGGAMVMVWPAAALFLSRPITASGLLGALLVASGLTLVALGPRTLATRSGLGWAWACAGTIAAYHVCYDLALQAGARRAPLFAVALGVALPMVLISLRARGALATAARPGLGEVLRWGLAGALCAGSFLLFVIGLAAAGAAVALTVRNTSVVFAQLLAVAIGERPRAAQVAGAVLVAIGAALVSR